MRNILRTFGAALALTIAVAAQALDVQEAKDAGWVGEQRDGYLGLVSNAAPNDARELLARINAERRASYQQIADRNNLDRQTVELLAAEKAIQKTLPGQYVQAADGSWVKK
jgi:uncharacterized protein